MYFQFLCLKELMYYVQSEFSLLNIGIFKLQILNFLGDVELGQFMLSFHDSKEEMNEA